MWFTVKYLWLVQKSWLDILTLETNWAVLQFEPDRDLTKTQNFILSMIIFVGFFVAFFSEMCSQCF